MKTISLTILSVLIPFMLIAKSGNYEKAMTSALTQLQQSKNVDDFGRAANTFKRIANAEPDKWLPEYYVAYSYIIMSFIDTTSMAKKDEYLDVASQSIDKIMESNPEGSEIYALRGFLFTARLVVDAATRGQKYMALSSQDLQKALALNPENPRALYMQLSNKIGMDRFFGNDVSKYCESINQLLKNWDEFNKSPEIYPHWGKPQVEKMRKNCQ